MKLKKRLLSVAVIAAIVTGSFAACTSSNKDNGTKATDPPAQTTTDAPKADAPKEDAAKDEPAPAEENNDAPAETSDLAPMALEVYSQPANFQGEQPGWTAKILKDKFNVTLNIIAPQAAGGDIFAARSAAGFLGDIVILDNADIQSCIKSGLIYDFTDEMKSFESFGEYQKQLDYYNAALDGVSAGQYYAWPTELANTSPKTFSPINPGTAPTMPWDYYKEIGAPEMKNLADLIDTLKQIQDAHPANAEGEPSYGITLWPDWDGTSIENVNQLTKWYGQEVNGAILLGTDNKMTELVDDNGAYKKILQFYFDANKAGVVDPDSGTQNWDSVSSKFKTKRAFLIWNDWQQGFWNTSARGNAGENYIAMPVDDMFLYQPSDAYYGSGRAFACGTNDAAKKERVKMVMNWMSSPEGSETIHGGIYGFTYVDDPNGKGFDQTLEGESALMNNSPVPAQYGGGLYADGMLQLNQWMLNAISINPLNGTSYDPRSWPTTKEKQKTTTTREWAERFGAENPMDYLTKNNKVGVVPFVNVSLAPDTSDISVIRTSCGPLVCDASWKMIFAKDQAEFDKIWNNLKTDLKGFGWDELVKFDMDKYKALVDERANVLANN